MELNTPDRIDVYEGKYTVQLHPNGRLDALRHGEPWQDLTGNNLVYWLAVELREARAARDELLEALQTILADREKMVRDDLVLHLDEALDMARLAVAKATGGEV